MEHTKCPECGENMQFLDSDARFIMLMRFNKFRQIESCHSEYCACGHVLIHTFLDDDGKYHPDNE